MLTLNFMTFFSYLVYMGMDIIVLLVGGFVYVKFTPINEIEEMARGNVAAATALAGAMVGFGCVLFSATTHSYGVLDTLIWSMVALIVQILAIELLRLVLRLVHDDWRQQIKDGCVAHGVFSAGFSLAVGLVNAACLT